MMMKLLTFNFLMLSVLTFAQTKVTDLSQFPSNKSTVISIDLSDKGLTVFPNEILACKNLKYLNLSNNGLTAIPADLKTLDSLICLDLSSNQNINRADLFELFVEGNSPLPFNNQ